MLARHHEEASLHCLFETSPQGSYLCAAISNSQAVDGKLDGACKRMPLLLSCHSLLSTLGHAHSPSEGMVKDTLQVRPFPILWLSCPALSCLVQLLRP